MKKKVVGIFVCMLLILASTSLMTLADWEPGDGHKMHFPQLPDSNGWDVYATAGLLQYPQIVAADDFQCGETGYIKDIHFWGSWKNDIVGTIKHFVIGIARDIPADPPEIPYSRPGNTIKEWTIYDWVESPPVDPPGMQGWYEPHNDYWMPGDHEHYYQYNVYLDKEDWVWQEEGKIYWLFISAIVEEIGQGQPQPLWGWKTADVDQYPEPYTGKHFKDDACWAHWYELDWKDLWEEGLEPVTNMFWVALDPNGEFYEGGGTDYYGKGWYYYPNTEWWNIWFYDHPFDLLRFKDIYVSFDLFKLIPEHPAYIEFAINWATPYWEPGGPPPIPPIENEEYYIERYTLLQSEFFDEGHYEFPIFRIPDYNPEWVSIDVRGYNFIIDNGIITHRCLKSLDLAFVITGEEPGEPCVDIEKKVSIDGGVTWVEEVDAKICTNVAFKIDVHNCGDYDLTNIVVVDTLPQCLEYVANSATPKEPTINGNNLIWTFNGPLKYCNTITIEFDAHVISKGENINTASVSAQSAGGSVSDSDTAIVNGISLVPDLDCEGSLSWAKVKPGSVVTGSFKVKNVGDPGSLLHWKIDSYPTWGTWTISPSMGTNLKPEDGPVTISVIVGVPDEKDEDFSGSVKVVNQMDSTDYCLIPVSLSTPVDTIIVSPLPGRLYASFTGDDGILIRILGDLAIYIFRDIEATIISYEADMVKFILENHEGESDTVEVPSQNEFFSYNFGKRSIGMYTLTAELYHEGEMISVESMGRIFSLSF